MKIDITTSATIRPGLLHTTLSSFRDNLLNTNHDYRLIINVDPAGEKDKTVIKKTLIKLGASFGVG